MLGRLEQTMLVVTHDLLFAAELCDRAVILSAGRIVADGNCLDILRDERPPRGPRPGAAAGSRPWRLPAAALICTFRRMADVAMPRLSDSMEEGTILKWLKSDGDEVSRGDEIVEIETDKANMTYEADQDGTLSIVAQEGDTLAVGETIARIGEGGSENGAAPAEREAQEGGEERRPARARPPRRPPRPRRPAASPPRRSPRATRSPPRPRAATGGSRRRRSHAAWRATSGSSSAALQGTGPGGRIVKADVEAASKGDGAQAAAPAEAPAAEPEPEQERAQGAAAGRLRRLADGKGETTTQDLTRLQQTVARRMAESKATAPEFVLTSTSTWTRPSTCASAQGRRRRGPVRAVVQRLRRQGLRPGAARLPARQRRLPRRQVRALLARERRRRGGGPGRAGGPDGVRRRHASRSAISRETRALAERVRAGAITPPELSSARSPSPTSACSGSRASSR